MAYNCADNPADRPRSRPSSGAIIAATQRALDYAHKPASRSVAAAGNGATDLGKPIVDDAEPGLPSEVGERAYERTIDNVVHDDADRGPTA